MDIDWRIVAVLSPVVLAASWAVFNVARYAIAQIQEFWNKEA